MLSNFVLCVNLACKESFSERAERDKADTQFLESWDNRLLWLPEEEGIFALERSNRLYGMCPADGCGARFGQAEVFHLAGVNQILYSSCNIFDGYVEIDTMLVKQVDAIHTQPLQRGISNLLNVFRATVQGGPLATVAGISFPSKLCRDHDPSAKRFERFTYKLFVVERTVDLGGVKECYAAVHGGVEE